MEMMIRAVDQETGGTESWRTGEKGARNPPSQGGGGGGVPLRGPDPQPSLFVDRVPWSQSSCFDFWL